MFLLKILFNILFFSILLHSEVRLKGVSMEPGAPGQWTVARVRVQNSGKEHKELELKWTLGSIESSVSEQSLKFFLQAESVRMVWVPMWIPEDILDKNDKSNTNNKKKRNFIEMAVQLFESGAMKSRETALGTMEEDDLMRGMNLGRNRDKVHMYDPLGDMKPTEGAVLPEVISWGKNRWTYKQRADEIQGYSYLYPDLLDRKSIFWIQKGYDQVHGIWEVLNWVERGGLLVIDPMDQSELGPLAQVLGIEIGAEVWDALKKVEWKLEGDRPLSGREIFTSSDWERLEAERGIQVASVRKWGLGKIAMLGYRWNALVGSDRERAKSILEDLHPKSFANEFESNLWNKDTQNSLVMKHGNTIWSRDTVMMYLGSLMLFSIILWVVPFFRQRKELRWGLWTIGMLGWTGGGLAVFLNKTSAGAKFSSEIISYGKSGGHTEKVVGYSVFYSESLRRFPVDFKQGLDAIRETPVKSNSMQKIENGLRFEDFSLQPMRINMLKWGKNVSLQLPQVKLSWGNDLLLSFPKNLHGKKIALVMGRKIWEVKASETTRLKLSDGRNIVAQADASVLMKTAYRLSVQGSKKKGSLGNDRNWLLYEADEVSPFDFPNDISKHETHVRVLSVQPEYAPGSFELAAGMSEWTFRRGKGVKSWKTNDLGFDGLNFVEENVNMSLSWRFELPSEIKPRVKAKQLMLKFAKAPENVAPNMVYALVKGKRQKLTVNDGKANLPVDALQDGAVEIEIQPPMPKVGASTVMRPPWRPWVEGIELKGTLQ